MMVFEDPGGIFDGVSRDILEFDSEAVFLFSMPRAAPRVHGNTQKRGALPHSPMTRTHQDY